MSSSGSPRPIPMSPTWARTQPRKSPFTFAPRRTLPPLPPPTFAPRPTTLPPPPATFPRSPSPPRLPRREAPCSAKSGASFSDFKGCIDCPTRTVSVPRIKYILNQRPVVYESIDSETRYDQVPVNYEFEKRVFPVKVTKPCPPCNDAPASPSCTIGGPFAPLPPWRNRRLPRSPRGIPCGMKTHSNFNRLPCSPDAFRRFGSPALPYGGRFSPFNFPRFKSQYVPTRASPCATQTTSLCGLRSKCSSC